MALVAAAVQARLPHPAAADAGAPDGSPQLTGDPKPAGDGHDALLRRLRELGELHRDGVLTDEEFTPAPGRSRPAVRARAGTTSPGAPP